MSILLSLLQEVDPAITASMAADLRSGLVAINLQAQAESACMEWSLNRWWQWLDDEGYDREAFLEGLRCLGAARISDGALADLGAACRSRGDEPGGLALVQALLEEIDADLIARLHQLEALAVAEDRELAQTAGGMSKGAEWGLIGGGSAVGLVVIGCVLYACCRPKRNDGHGGQLDERVEQATESVLQSEMHSAVHTVREVHGDVIRAGRELRNDGEQVGGELIRSAAADPMASFRAIQEIQANLRDIKDYTVDDIEVRAQHLLGEHTTRYIGDLVKQLLVEEFKSSDKFKQKVAESAATDVERELGLPADAITEISPETLAIAEKNVMESEWYRQEYEWLRNTGAETRLRSAEMKKVKNAYQELVAAEVKAAKAAKRDARQELANPDFYDMLGLDGQRIVEDINNAVEVSKVEIHKDVVKKAQDLKAAERDAAQIVDEDFEAAGGLL